MESIADELFKEFKENSIAEFFRKNRQMLGYAGKVRSLTTIVHEYVTNSLDATEEAGILPEIRVEVKEMGEDKYSVLVRDNGHGIPKNIVGKALASILSGTKFHRYMQQRGQQGIGASGCTLFAQITTGKPIHVRSSTGKESYECDLSIDIKSNKPIVSNMRDISLEFRGLEVYGEFADVKYENSEHGVFEYIKRTALANPHASISLLDPTGKEYTFLRSVNAMPKKPKVVKPHPLGLEPGDLVEFAHRSESRRISSFLMDSFSRVSEAKINELKQLVSFDLSKSPKELTWQEAEELIKAFKSMKWVAPEFDSVSPIGEKYLELAMKNIINPEFISVVERKPKVFRGGIPFVVEAAIAYGGGAGRKNDEGEEAGGNIIRFANKVPLLFDSSTCAITYAVRSIDWKRYSIKDFDQEPVSVLVNVSSVFIPYSGVGKQAIAQEDSIIDEIKLAVMDAARNIQRYISNVRSRNLAESKYKTIMRYITQLSSDLSELTGNKQEILEEKLKKLVDTKYKKLFEADEQASSTQDGEQSTQEEEQGEHNDESEEES
ncbi:MAG: DNA topoisomerase VI subunit B [Candidatus Micrarchaeota archaeon]